jgi:hypothetical protein
VIHVAGTRGPLVLRVEPNLGSRERRGRLKLTARQVAEDKLLADNRPWVGRRADDVVRPPREGCLSRINSRLPQDWRRGAHCGGSRSATPSWAGGRAPNMQWGEVEKVAPAASVRESAS